MMSNFAAREALAGDKLAEVAEAALEIEDLPTAVALFNRAEPDVADPDRCAGGRWLAHMLAGDFEAAWRESDAVRRRGAPDPHRFWTGEDLRGRRLMLRSLHGFGDAVQMFRFLPRLQTLISHLIVEVPPRLAELAPCFAGMGQVITWGHDAPANAPAWDVQMEVMELPYALRVQSGDLEPRCHYLRLPDDLRSRVEAVFGEHRRARVGVVWSAGHWNRSRSVPFADFQELLHVEGIEFWNLQGDPDRVEWLTLGQTPSFRDSHLCSDGIAPLAAMIERMDLVITVDTLAAHLAGALAVPCWVLLQSRADWRWMAQREDSPWYPSVHLLRQSVGGDWPGLLARVRRALGAWVTDKEARATGKGRQ